AIVGEESQHATLFGQFWHNQVNALGKGMMMIGVLSGQLIMPVDPGAGGIDDHASADLETGLVGYIANPTVPEIVLAPGADGLHVIGRTGSGIQRIADEAEHEAGIVVVKVGVGVFETTQRLVGVDDRLLTTNVSWLEEA